MSARKLGKGAKMSAQRREDFVKMTAKRREDFLSMTADSRVPPQDTEGAAAQPTETIGTGSPRPSDG
jgi:predicted sulfurtransferase